MSNRLAASILRSAWPTTAVDRLLRASLIADDAAAAAAWRDFEKVADFDRLSNGEMRLIGVVAKRMRKLEPDSPMRARIGGFERANWARSQLTIGETARGLRKLEVAGVEMLLVKGAARAVAADAAARGRTLNDVDVVVGAEQMERAFDILTADGWEPAGSGTTLYQRTQLPATMCLNLVRGRFGNFDLHRGAFHSPYNAADEDVGVWTRAAGATLGGVAVRVPSPTDSAVIAIAHGALDAHKSSDWLADVAAAIDAGVDWTLFETIVTRRRLQAPAAVALGYAAERLERLVPEAPRARLEAAAFRRPFALIGALAETRPKSRTPGSFWLARAVAKQARLLKAPTRGGSAYHRPLPTLIRQDEAAGAGVLAVTAPIDIPGRVPGRAWDGFLDVTLLVELPPVARRLEFELNAGGRHLARLRASVRASVKARRFRFRLALTLAACDENPLLTSAHSRRFNSDAPAALLERYAAAPFRLIACRATGSPRD